jgi:hypothetical protein
VSGYTLDAGALVAVEHGDLVVRALLQEAVERGRDLRVPAAALAQVWREPAQQARLGQLLKKPQVTVVPLDAATARATGFLCAVSGTADVVDASVAVCAHLHGDKVVTSDPSDLARLVGRDRVIAI